MPRKWMFLAAAMISVSVLTVGVAGADDEDSPLHKLMERVNAKNLAITKGVRTAVAFKKAQTDVVAAAEELTKLAKEARELGKDTVKKAKDVPNAADQVERADGSVRQHVREPGQGRRQGQRQAGSRPRPPTRP